MTTARRDRIHQIETEVQNKWEESKIFEQDAPDEKCDKFFATFPYPYMNGLLHIGHAFSLTKAIFATNFQRLQGKKVLFPFGYHCTGMPIQAAANKLKREMAKFGSPIPTFPAGLPQVSVNKDDVPELDDDGKLTLKWKVPAATGGKSIKCYHIFMSADKGDFKEISVVPHVDGKLMTSKVSVESGGCTYKIVAELADGSMCPESEVSGEVNVGAAPAAKAGAPTGKKVAKKLLMKTGGAAFQWEILSLMGIKQDAIPAFADPEHWVKYFPPLGTRDLKRFGCPSDFRRSFVTTSLNPYYDQFIRWQFRKLKATDKIGFGKRATIYSELDGQACMDHDRAEGEGVAPQEYTAIKVELLEFPPAMETKLKGKKVFLLAGTLRPETMPGQTNCWILPEGAYGCYKADETTIYVCSHRAARNMSFQDILKPFGKPECVMEVKGKDFIGKKVKCPQTKYPAVHILPLATIKMDKGTAVVTSVPSDSPDDYAAYMDLMKPGKREYFGIKAEWVEPFELIPILEVEVDGEMRQMSAQYMCEKLGVQSQNDKLKLQEAHDTCYKLGFDKGIMTAGPMKGMPVKKAKFDFRKLMIDAGEAFLYSEPEKKVVSRTGDECVVAGIDQWYLKYGEEHWRASVEKFLLSDEFNTYNDRIKDSFIDAIAWLKEWACSRSFGLGTRVPWDEKFLIESLSDSTIYMAYYTVAHLLQSDVLGAKVGPEGIKPSDLTDEVWDFIFLNGPEPKKSNATNSVWKKLRHEFRFWYPLNLRVSARDLVQNHLTMALYNHAAVWEKEPDMWPRSIFCNGMLLMNNEKMSKSKGNFFTLEEIINKYSADAVRVACANGGDSMEDGNFEVPVAEKAVLDFPIFLDALKQTVDGAEPMSDTKEDARFVDRWFANEMNRLVIEARSQYDRMAYREALRACYFEFGNAKDLYRDVCKSAKYLPNKKLMLRYYEWQLIVLSPIAPHICEHGWGLLGKKSSIIHAKWPEPSSPVDESTKAQGKYMYDKVPHDFVKLLEKVSKSSKPTGATVYVASKYPEWKITVLKILKSKLDAGKLPLVSQDEMKGNKVAEEQWKDIMKEFMQDASLKAVSKHLGPFAAFKREEAVESGASALSTQTPFDEFALLKEHVAFLANRLHLEESAITVFAVDDAKPEHADKAKESQPLKPAVVYEVPAGVPKPAGGKAGAGGKPASEKKVADKKGAPAASATIKDLKTLNDQLSTRSYFEGGAVATAADFAQLKDTPIADANQYPHVARWSKHISFLQQKKQQF